MTFRELKEQSGMGLKEFSNHFGVPYRTVQNWNAGSNDCPEYLLSLFEYKLKNEGMLTGDTGLRFDQETIKAYRIKVVLTGGIDKYAASFLAIYNNVKSDAALLKMYNDYDNGVYVVCTAETRDATVRFLEQFGNVTRMEAVDAVKLLASGYENTDIDYEFLEPEE